MRHRKSGVKLNRTTSHRQAMFRNMVTSLLKHDRITTTDAKAKELRRWADHIVTLAKRGDLHARRMAMSIVREKDVVQKIFEEAPERFGSIHGGYTRIVKIGRRPGDAASLTLVELTSQDDTKTTEMKKIKSNEVEKPAVGEPKAVETIAPAADRPAPVETDTPSEAADVETGANSAETEAPEKGASPEKDGKAGTDSAETDK